MDTQMFEEIEALKPKGISMSSFLVQLIEKGKMKPATVHEEMATREIGINAAINSKQYAEVTAEEERNTRDQIRSYQLNQGNLTFNEIIEKHKEELDKKYK